MATAALEALSNKELRQKCIEHGMPNVPVTDSSRKILIRRLEAVMSGKPATPNKTNRRETMHVSKPSEMKEMASSAKITAVNNNNTTSNKTPASNRPSRRTIAATERHVTTTTTVSEPEYSDVSPDRGEDVPKMLPPKAKTPEKPTLYPKLPAKEPSPKPQILSKTGVVSTSYVQESSINKTYASPEDDGIDSTEEDIIEEPIKKTLSNVAPTYTSYVPLSESKVSTSAPLSQTLSSSTRYSSLGSSYNYSKPTTTTSSTSSVRQSYEAPTRTSYQTNRIGKPYVTEAFDVEDEDEDEDEEDEVVLVEDSPVGKDVQTPFLSQFARNLETLKATPLRHSVGPTKITPPKSASTLRNRGDTAYTRRTIGATGGSISARRSYVEPEKEDSPFRQFMMAMEEKYHLKQTFIIISIFIIAIFIYVFFIQSV